MSDLISRKALCEFCLNTKDRTVDANDIMRFPSSEPERKKGRWIDVTEIIGFPDFKCSVCQSKSGSLWMNFCPNCGAEMTR